MLEQYYDLLNIVCRFFQAFPLVLVIFFTFTFRRPIKYKKLFFTFSLVILGAVDSILFENSGNFTLYFFSLFVMLFMYVIVFFEGWIFLKGVICMILLIYRSLLVPVGDMTAIKILQEGAQPLSGLPYLCSQVIIALLMLPLAWFLIKYKITPQHGKSPVWVRLVTLLMSVITLSLIFLVQTIPDSSTNVAYNLCMIFIVTICYFIIYNLIQSLYKEIEYSIQIEQLKFEKKYEEELQDSYQNLKKLRHDFKNHLLCINLMLKQQEYRELECYCEELTENVYSLKQHIDTGNLIANVVLNQKYLQAVSRSVPVNLQASLPENVNIRKMDLCALLSNLFDNALEASEKVENPWIKIEIKPVKNYIYILFENKINQVFPSGATAFETSKENKEEHGFGLGIIEEITKKYDGLLDITANEDCFRIKIMIRQ